MALLHHFSRATSLSVSASPVKEAQPDRAVLFSTLLAVNRRPKLRDDLRYPGGRGAAPISHVFGTGPGRGMQDGFLRQTFFPHTEKVLRNLCLLKGSTNAAARCSCNS